MAHQQPIVEGIPDGFGGGYDATDGFVEHIGLVLDRVTPERVEAHLDVQPFHLQPYGIMHGGVHTSIVETLGSVGAAANVAARVGQERGVVGVANQTDFLRPVTGGRLRAVATPIHAGRTQQLWEVLMHDTESDKLCSRGQVRLQVIELPAHG